MTLEISVGRPPVEGRYVAFVQCAGNQVSEWCEPIIATYHGDRWHCGQSVYGWIGPLPLAKRKPLFDAHFPEPKNYDL